MVKAIASGVGITLYYFAIFGREINLLPWNSISNQKAEEVQWGFRVN